MLVSPNMVILVVCTNIKKKNSTRREQILLALLDDYKINYFDSEAYSGEALGNHGIVVILK